MANEDNTVGFNAFSSCHQEVWRKNAARQAADDRYTELFFKLVEAYGDINGDPDTANYFCGMRDAYICVTGDGEDMVMRQVRDALDRQLREELAEEALVPVASSSGGAGG